MNITINDANTEKHDGYDVVDASLFYDISDKKGTKYRLSFEINNLFDEHYSQSAWYGYGTANYAVSWPRTFWASLTINW